MKDWPCFSMFHSPSFSALCKDSDPPLYTNRQLIELGGEFWQNYGKPEKLMAGTSKLVGLYNHFSFSKRVFWGSSRWYSGLYFVGWVIHIRDFTTTVDGRNSAPVDMENLQSFAGFHTSGWCTISSINSTTCYGEYFSVAHDPCECGKLKRTPTSWQFC